MSGNNQHYIPQAVLRGHKIPDSGKKGKVWVYRRGEHARARAIKKVAAEESFYSQPATDGSPTLDDLITKYENRLSNLVAGLRDGPVGPVLDAAVPSEILAHLTVRGEHIRGAIAHGARLVALTAFGIFSDEDHLRKEAGLDEAAPGLRFRELVQKVIADSPPAKLGWLPVPLLERMAFAFMKENFSDTFEANRPVVANVLGRMHNEAGTMARSSHAKALSQTLAPPPRIDQLSKLGWVVTELEGPFILPDCVAVAFESDGIAHPLMMADCTKVTHVVMPLTGNRLLVGSSPDAANQFEPSVFNVHAAACSNSLFFCSVHSPELQRLSDIIGTQAFAAVDRGIAAAGLEFEERRPPSEVKSNKKGAGEPVQEIDGSAIPSCPMHFLGCGLDEPTAQKIANSAYAIASAVASVVPLNRLDGITFAADYHAALRELDRGFASTVPLSATVEENAVGVAMAPAVLRDGLVKCHIVVQGYLGKALISDDEGEYGTAAHALAYQLGHVACVEMFDEALPGVMLHPAADAFEAHRYKWIDGAWSGYFAARLSAGIDPGAGVHYRALVLTELKRLQDKLPQVRLDYRFHRDIDRLLNGTLKHVGALLHYAATYLGHCDGLEESSFDADGELNCALTNANLTQWFRVYRDDLRRVWDRRGEWSSVNEFFDLGLHVERIVWPFGIFLWSTPDSGIHVEVPLATDAARLKKEVFRRPGWLVTSIAKNLFARFRASKNAAQRTTAHK